ncbi:peptidase domain-containing ABC transporter [uncultured Prochlorococcus sp.]|uniref:peptidase domain-containing ABC transporter n=1 Tax=uncultured Prochlorococcus sp. TaxID=159733 RepID=UPI002583DF3E|nr:peptidase domain-containing ABC transporter [uncultured Prochlorococcus sp.]
MEKYPNNKVSRDLNEYLTCFKMLSTFFDIPFKQNLLGKVINDQITRNEKKILQPSQISSICELIGLKASIKKIDITKIENDITFPALGLLNNRLVIYWEYKSQKFLIGDPKNGQIQKSLSEINKNNLKILPLILIEKDQRNIKNKFGWSWFLPALKKNTRSLSLVILSSFFVQLFGVFNPLLIQQIIDSVISQGNISSLNILGTFLIFMALMQGILYVLRTYIFSEVSNNIDINLGSSIIRNLFRLPLGYFSKRKVGEISTRINELEKIRSFLTGTALTAILDTIFSIIYILIMCIYSIKLTICSLLVIPLFMALVVIFSPISKRYILNQAVARAKVNSHLVEGISGIESIKSQGLEFVTESKWENFYQKQIDASFNHSISTSIAGSINNFLQQISGLIIIWIGAFLVVNGELTIGGLIAFRILSSFVTSPILRITSLWQSFQETIISLERLADILDHPLEEDVDNQLLPSLQAIKGKVSFENVSFNFSSSSSLALSDITFNISPGNFVGIVGKSGSGKSTLLKLLNRLLGPYRGGVFIDNVEISKINLYSLRSQIGFFPQESFLFDGSVQENIALSRPEASFEEISHAAWIACADDFIQKLPNGYATPVGEKGANLSGGQKQRIALARGFLSNPNLLILDESTSALDLFTENKLINRIKDSFPNKTIFFITHRLNKVKDADQILVIENGKIVEKGKHAELLEIKGSYFKLLEKHIEIS